MADPLPAYYMRLAAPPSLAGQTPALRTDGQVVPGGPAGKIGPPRPPHPWTLNWWIDNALAFTAVGAGQGIAEAVDAFGRLPRNPTWGELLPAVGQGALAAVGAVPVVGPEVRAGVHAARATDAVHQASKSARIFDPPRLPQRSFAEDYPQGTRSDATGRLTHDIEGRELTAERVVGRRMVGGDDVALPPAELDALAEALTGTRPKVVAPREIRPDVGRYHEGWDPVTGNWTRVIALSRALSAAEAPRVLGHEVGHAIAETAGQIPTKGIARELRGVYNTLNNPIPGRQAPTQRRLLHGPEQSGYSGARGDDEMVAEAIRAYMTDPNYLKTVAPDVAARIRKHVNSHPRLSRVVQFNSMAPLLTAGGFGALMPFAEERP